MAESKTEKDSFWEERLVGSHHYKTTITTDDGKKITARASDKETAEKRAAKKLEKHRNKD